MFNTVDGDGVEVGTDVRPEWPLCHGGMVTGCPQNVLMPIVNKCHMTAGSCDWEVILDT